MLANGSTITGSNVNIGMNSRIAYSAWQKVLIGISLTFVSLFTTFGNLSTIYVYKTTRRLRRPQNYLILTLALADLTVGIVSINLFTVYLLVGSWPFGAVGCYAWLVTDHWAVTISNFTLVAIAMDRFLSVCFPIQHRWLHTKRKYVQMVLVVVVVLAFVSWCPLVTMYVETGNQECLVSGYKQTTTSAILTFIYGYLGPVVLLSMAYLCISYNMMRRCHTMYTVYPKMGEKQLVEQQLVQVKQRKSCFVTSSTRCRHIQANRRGVEFLLLISLAFICLWMPYYVMFLILGLKKIRVSEHWWNFCYVIGWINSALNPLCYVIGNKQFRGFFLNILQNYKNKRKLLQKRRCKESSSDSSTGGHAENAECQQGITNSLEHQQQQQQELENIEVECQLHDTIRSPTTTTLI